MFNVSPCPSRGFVHPTKRLNQGAAISSARRCSLNRRSDWIWATLGEGGLVLAVAALGWATRQPLIFASLGPTAYEMVEQPRLRSARIYNIVVGHMIGLGMGFLALWALHAWGEPNVLSAGIVTAPRLWASTLAATLTTLLTLILRAGQPAALATTLLVSVGAMQTSRSAIAIVAGVLIITAIGEPVRRLRLRFMEADERRRSLAASSRRAK